MRILIVGLGSIAAKHIAAIRQLEKETGAEHEIYALRSSRTASGMERISNIFTIEEAMDLKPDLIIVSNPTGSHAATISEFAGSGIPMMIEKPVFERPVYEELINRMENSLTYVACNLRFLESLRHVAEAVKSGTLPGRINEVNIYCGSSLPSWRLGSDFRKSYSANPELGGGVQLDLIHELDYACHIFGMPQKTYGIARSCSSLDIRAVDYANYIYIYPGFCANIILNYYRPDYKRVMEIIFDNDIWTIDIASNCITDMSGKTVFSSSQRIIDTYTDQMAYVIGLVERGENNSCNDIRQANEILKIASRYERS